MEELKEIVAAAMLSKVVGSLPPGRCAVAEFSTGERYIVCVDHNGEYVILTPYGRTKLN